HRAPQQLPVPVRCRRGPGAADRRVGCGGGEHRRRRCGRGAGGDRGADTERWRRRRVQAPRGRPAGAASAGRGGGDGGALGGGWRSPGPGVEPAGPAARRGGRPRRRRRARAPHALCAPGGGPSRRRHFLAALFGLWQVCCSPASSRAARRDRDRDPSARHDPCQARPSVRAAVRRLGYAARIGRVPRVADVRDLAQACGLGRSGPAQLPDVVHNSALDRPHPLGEDQPGCPARQHARAALRAFAAEPRGSFFPDAGGFAWAGLRGDRGAEAHRFLRRREVHCCADRQRCQPRYRRRVQAEHFRSCAPALPCHAGAARHSVWQVHGPGGPSLPQGLQEGRSSPDADPPRSEPSSRL
ncbi:unnamed protein product, partial [Prorocentrum cordatum]